MLEHNGDLNVALSLAHVARRGLPESPKTADTLAWAYYHKGTYGLAIDLSTAEKRNDRFVEYLQRVMRHGAPIAAPEDVVWFRASYARDALAGIRDAELSALAAVCAALEEALGLKFEGDKGEHFFRSSLVQTLFYGIFSAWVLWSCHNPPTSRKRFDSRLSAWSLRVAMISRLFSLVASPQQLDTLKLSEVLDWTGAALNRVDRASFFGKFEEGHAVQYFYEPFLEAFGLEKTPAAVHPLAQGGEGRGGIVNN
jgi:hypothetical protein